MNIRIDLPKIFETDVESKEDFEKRIQEIRGFFINKSKGKGKDWKTFYRGDRYCTQTQSKLFRYGELADEADIFKNWKETNRTICEKYPDEFMQLAYMQHEKGNTRLLDFTEDPLVALRFACGDEDEKEKCRKKVTIYMTTCIDYDPQNPKPEEAEVIKSYMRLVKSGLDLNYIENDKEAWMHDTFVRVPKCFPRIRQQAGLFLIMGNFTTSELIEGKPQTHPEKKIHELSPTIGRGENYVGYVGVLGIKADKVDDIRGELEDDERYQIEYLMAKSEPETETCLYETNTSR